MRPQLRIEFSYLTDYPWGRVIWACAWRAGLLVWFTWQLWQFAKA